MTATTPSSFFASAFETLGRRVHTARVRRTQRLALATLMEMDAHQLDDLGLNVGDIVDALNAPPPRAALLDARRSRRSRTWSPAPTATAH